MNIKIEVKHIIHAAIAFLAAFFAFIVMMLSGEMFSYGSPEFGNWAMWVGSLFSGVAATGALFAANFTRKTLLFLTRQHDDQLEMQKMPMYLAHKDAFYKLLEQIETSHSNKFTFKNKELIYQSLFPNNDFFTFSAKASLESSNGEPHVTLTNIIDIYHEYSVNNNADFYAKNSQFLSNLTKLFHVEVVDHNSIGNVYSRVPNHSKLLWNVFEMSLLTAFIKDATIQLFRFTGNIAPESTKWQSPQHPTLVAKIIQSVASMSTDYNPTHIINLQGDKYDVISQLAKFMEQQHNGEVGHLVTNQHVYAQLRPLFESGIERFQQLINDKKEQLKLLDLVGNWLMQSLKENGSDWPEPLKDKIYKQIKQLDLTVGKLQEEIHKSE